jgi:arylsulfatase A-like enzyme
MTNRALLLVWVAAFGCGKSTKDVATNEAMASPSPTAAQHPNVKPAVAPAQQAAAARGPERIVYSLVDNRLSGHLGRGGGLLVEAGSAGFAKYLRFNSAPKDKRPWQLGKTVKDVKAARMNGKSAFVYVPLTAAQAGRSAVRLRIYAGAAGNLSLRVNDHKDINGKLTEGWSTIDLAIPAGQLVEGENALQLFTSAPDVALAWLHVGASTPLADDPAGHAFAEPAASALVLPSGGDMAWYVLVPEKARLVGDSACALAVHVVAEDGATLDGKLGTGTVIELGTLAGKAARVEVANAGCAPKATLANAALVVPGEPPVAKKGDAPKYVLFVIMDSLRFDRVRAFHPKARPEAPNFEKLAEDSTLFMQHYVQGNESQVSHASMWSSTYLAKHKAAKMSDKLADKWTTIDEVAKAAGKFTAGVSANGYIRPARGFGPKWDRYINHIEKGGGLKGADVMDRGLGYIEPKKTEPWFLYLGMIDTHVTWRAKQPWLDKYDGGYKGRFATQFGDDGPTGFPKDLTDAEKDHVRALYDSNVSYQDDLLGKLRAKLEGWGIWNQTMLIITADHGDEQWEDGRVGHAASELETLIHVPLLIHYPPLFPGAKIASGTEGIDIVPTVAEALGVTMDAEWQGASLVALANGAIVYPQLAMSSQYENFHGGRIGPWKVRLAGTNAPKLFHLGKDPAEKKDVYGSSPVAARLLVDAMWMLRAYNVEWKKQAWGTAANVTSRFAADLGE